MSVTDKLASRIPVLADRVERKDVVAVVKLHGVITPSPSPLARGAINLAAVETALTRAFGHDRLKAVALLVNSPGGAPTQSGLVAERIRQLADEKGVPVLAFCEDVAASGGYWLACAADEIYAHRTSMVGSIGVISGGFGFTGLLERFGIERRLHTAGANKSRLDPFSPEKPEDVEWLKKMHTQLHELFVNWVKERRGDRLTDTEDLFTGDVWLGAKALDLGLIDGLGSLRQIITERYPDAEISVAEPKKPLLARLGLGAPAAASAVLDAVTQKAAWARFGL
ncbi:serine protease [Amycolatopsis mediterranei S699]|uniref:Serine protease n=1 Tax=Amycolatopsis mediterranei (strain U-32) TaxID=749927 RepID=A0A0H3CX94_AMYMU|nr:S49 family peptidase [Amycolatopsis mediterranei]ADJ41956.1 serine protease [Amycolatopsis mediterranei U32]AFO73666.1 serine protease [Amycolatopsis mediterranei S699]AGT80795.1 serine protease [Amycolatopsis mediterranei RB]KDO08788.1 peptidase S49 [Amycolatopsis mediterranei]KDU89543.1 peptidase S49 [Amycolatopsis mediterranei]